jgi:hypothetical protein
VPKVTAWVLATQVKERKSEFALMLCKNGDKTSLHA